MIAELGKLLKCDRPTYRLSDSVTDGPDSRDTLASKNSQFYQFFFICSPGGQMGINLHLARGGV